MVYTSAIESNVTALSGVAALFIPGYERNSPDAPSDFDRLISGYRLIWGYRITQTALLGHCTVLIAGVDSPFRASREKWLNEKVTIAAYVTRRKPDC